MDELLRQAATDPNAFGKIYEETIQQVFRYCMVLTNGDEDESWDLCSDTYMKALATVGNYKDQGYQYVSYLYRIARNLFIDGIRKRKTQEKYSTTLIHEEEDRASSIDDIPDSILQQKEEELERTLVQKEVQKLLLGLPPDERELLHMRFEQDMKYSDIATILGIPLSTIKVKFHRLTKKLQDTFSSLHPSPL